MKRPLIMKLAIVGVVLLGFIGYTEYDKYKETHFKVDASKFNVKASLKEIKASRYDEIGGLELAEKYNVVVNVEKTVPFTKVNREITFHEVWLRPNIVYLLYSTNLLKADENLQDVPKFKFTKVTYHMDGGKTIETKVNEEQFAQSTLPILGQTLNHRVYRSLMVFNQGLIEEVYKNNSNGDFTNYHELIEEKLSHLTSITLGGVELESSEQEVIAKLKPITLNASFNLDKMLIKTIPINQTITIDKSTKVTFNSFKKFIDRNELEYQVESSNDQLGQIKLQVNSSGEQSDSEQGGHFNDFEFYIDQRNHSLFLPMFQTMPEALTITPIQNTYSKKVSFELTKDQLEEAEQLVEKHQDIKVADIKNGTVYFGFKKDQPNEPTIFPYVRIESDQKASFRPDQINPMTQWRYNFMKESLENDVAEERMKQSVISLKNKDGIEITEDIRGESRDEDSQSIIIGVNPANLPTDGLSVAIDSIPYIKKLKDKSITIKLK